MKNLSKTIKTILFASLIAALILPFSAMDFAEAKNDKHNGKDIIKNVKSDNDIPLQKELRKTLAKQHKEAKSQAEKTNLEKQVKKIDRDIQKWYKDNSNPEKEQFAREKQEVLTEALIAESKIPGFEDVPFTSIGYDYVDRSLEVTLDPAHFNEENIEKYLKKIRKIVGDEVDITISPEKAHATEVCATGRCSTSNPIKGGVEFDLDPGAASSTIGFAATYNGDSGFVTAGHTVDGKVGSYDVEQPNYGPDIGDVTKEMFYNWTACDCAFIKVDTPGWSMDDGVYGMVDPSQTANPFVGMTVTLSAKASGLESGTVTDTSETKYLDTDGDGYGDTWVRYLVVSTYSSQAGDSGGPVMSGNSLIGIHAASGGHFTKHSKFTTYFNGLTWDF